MSFRRTGALIVVLLLSTLPTLAQPRAALSTFSLLQFDASARSAAMGGAFAAVADGDVNSMFYNPAIPGPSTSQVPSLTYLNHLSDINSGTVAYSHTLRGSGTTVSGGLRFVHWGTLEGRNERGEPTGSFSANDAILTGGASRRLGRRARYGANVHVLHAQIESEQALALAGDLGVVVGVPNRQLVLGASLRHVGVSISGFGQRDASIPLDLQLGLSKRLAHLPLLVSVSAYDLTNLDEGIEGGSTIDHVLAHFTFGGEMALGEALRVRLGYNHRRSKELSLNDQLDLAGLGGGFGLSLDGLFVDYSYNSWADLGALHRFTLRVDLTER